MEWDWSFVWEIMPTLLQGVVVTIEATILGTALALVLGLVFALLRRSRRRAVAAPVTFLVEFVRGTPLLVQLYFLFYVLPDLGILLPPLGAGVIGLGLHYATYVSEMYRAGIDSVPPGQWEAATALNLPRWHTWTRVILPQAIPRSIPALTNYLIALFKDVPQLVAITVAEPFFQARELSAQTFRTFEAITMAGLAYLVTAFVLSFFGRLVERRYGKVYQ
jgi:polar amino acid transport system permease protein